MLQGESKSEEQLGELRLFSLKKWRLRKICEVVPVSLFLSEELAFPGCSGFSLAAGQCLDTSGGCCVQVWPLRVSHQGSDGLFWAGLKPSWPISTGGEGLGLKHEPHTQQWRTGTDGFIIPGQLTTLASLELPTASSSPGNSSSAPNDPCGTQTSGLCLSCSPSCRQPLFPHQSRVWGWLPAPGWGRAGRQR